MWNLFVSDKDDSKRKDFDDKIDKVVDDKKMSLRSEKLDIDKKKVKVGEVEFGKEIVEELKEVDVPVTHEEVVIERRSINNEPCDSIIDAEESIHIPVSKEIVDVDKHTVVTGEVVARKKVLEGTEHVKEVLKKEEARIVKDGDTNVVSDNDFH